ncbi:MAG: hypothetical protein JO276_16755 [Sphingomonadaceae bacterium]|nr:hypothetical protein [Sphingomonadaceae bacterium]
MAEGERLGLGARLVIGGIAGFVATMAMTSAMRRLHRQLPAKERYPLTPREIVDSALDRPPAAGELTLVAHFAYGAGCGALIGAATVRPGRLGGAAAGGAVWLGSYMGWIPAMGILKPATQHPLRRDLVMLGAHFVWGWATAEAMRELAEARVTIFAAGPEPDRADGGRAAQSQSRKGQG